MAIQVSNIFDAALSRPVISCGLLLLLVFPVFQLLVYFFPLFISTALCVLALVTVGPSFHRDEETSNKQPSLKDDSSWLGRVRCLQESARAWLDSKLRIKDLSASLQEEDDDDTRDSEEVSLETEHEKRVHQLEKTLRTLSFVSLEGIFECDGTAMDSLDDITDPKPSLPAENDEAEQPGGVPQPEATAEVPAPVAPPEVSKQEQQEDQSETSSNDSSSWQEVEHTKAEL